MLNVKCEMRNVELANSHQSLHISHFFTIWRSFRTHIVRLGNVKITSYFAAALAFYYIPAHGIRSNGP